MRRVLLTGGSGFLGWNFCRLFANDFEIFATYYHNHVKISGVFTDRVDITDYDELKEAYQTIKPDIVLHFAAASKPDWCLENKSESAKINVDAAINIAGLCADGGIPFCFTSTDLVFDGNNAPYNEKYPVSPINLYGEQKVLAEEGIKARSENYIIFRTPMMYGVPGPTAQNFMIDFIDTLKKKKRLRAFSDEYRTPAGALSVCRGIKHLLDKTSGIIHIGGSERVSRYDFALILKDVLQISDAKIEPSSRNDASMTAVRPKDVSLDSSLAFSLGYNPLTIKEQLEEMKKEFKIK